MAAKLPTLYKKTSTGKIQMWEIKVIEGSITATPAAAIVTTYGLVDGKKQETVERITEGKNLGKANQTDSWQQAHAEALSQWEKKKKKGYVENIEDAESGVVDTNMITGGIDPMLAQTYEKHSAKIKYPAYAQPKLDGHRCIAIIQDGKCTLWSRTRKRINSMPHIVAALEKCFGNANIVIDGELYNHDYRDRFEELTSKIRQSTPQPGHEVVQYWIYDVVVDALEFARRNDMLELMNEAIKGHDENKTLVIVSTFQVDDEEDMVAMFGAVIDNGYEGLMVRNKDGKYKNKRSYDLQKVKVFQDAEYPVIDVTEGRGKMAGRAMFHCVTPNGQEFRVKMIGKLDDLEHYLINKNDYIGRDLTVKFQKFSAEGLPIFPVAMRFREDV